VLTPEDCSGLVQLRLASLPASPLSDIVALGDAGILQRVMAC
jgi:hypothetical protein